MSAALPPEPEPGAVITFTVQYEPDGTVYTFVASRLAGYGWALSGSQRPQAWGDVLGKLQLDHAVRSGHRAAEYHLVTKWKKVTV